MAFVILEINQNNIKLLDIFRLSVGRVILMIRDFKNLSITRSITSVLLEINLLQSNEINKSHQDDYYEEAIGLVSSLTKRFNALDIRLKRIESTISKIEK